jgi:hypothetical protein
MTRRLTAYSRTGEWTGRKIDGYNIDARSLARTLQMFRPVGKGWQRMHKFVVGQIVKFSMYDGSSARGGPYTVTGQLPGSDFDPEYRIKSELETYQRAARESHMKAVAETPRTSGPVVPWSRRVVVARQSPPGSSP